MNGIQLKFQATDEQVQQMEQECRVFEGLLALTLAQRIQGMKPEESVPVIEDWFRSVRTMGQTAFITSGIKTEVATV